MNVCHVHKATGAKPATNVAQQSAQRMGVAEKQEVVELALRGFMATAVTKSARETARISFATQGQENVTFVTILTGDLSAIARVAMTTVWNVTGTLEIVHVANTGSGAPPAMIPVPETVSDNVILELVHVKHVVLEDGGTIV